MTTYDEKPAWWRPFDKATSFVDGAKRTVANLKGERCMAWVGQNGEKTNLTFSDVWQGAETIAYALVDEWEQEPGNRVLLCYAPGTDFFVAFLGCLRASIVGVPV